MKLSDFYQIIIGEESDGQVTPYLTRIMFGRLRIHIFHRGDADPDPHDHPAPFWTFPLTSYVEEYHQFPECGCCEMAAGNDAVCRICFVDGSVQPYRRVPRIVRAFRLHYRPADHTHRVVGRLGKGFRLVHPQQTAENLSVPGPIVTIVWWGRRTRDWGFLKTRDGRSCWVAWKDYVFNGGKTAPCAD